MQLLCGHTSSLAFEIADAEGIVDDIVSTFSSVYKLIFWTKNINELFKLN